jgi:hypothetical protein
MLAIADGDGMRAVAVCARTAVGVRAGPPFEEQAAAPSATASAVAAVSAPRIRPICALHPTAVRRPLAHGSCSFADGAPGSTRAQPPRCLTPHRVVRGSHPTG